MQRAFRALRRDPRYRPSSFKANLARVIRFVGIAAGAAGIGRAGWTVFI